MTTIICFALMTTIPLSLVLFKIPKWSPAFVFGLFWWAQFSVCYVGFSNMPWSPVSAAYIALCSLSVVIGFRMTFGKGTACIAPETRSIPAVNYPFAKSAIVCFIVLGMTYALVSMRRYGYSIRSLFNLKTLLQMNNQIAVARYSGTAESAGLVGQILLSFTYAAPLAGGSFFPYARTKPEKILCFLTLLPELIVLF